MDRRESSLNDPDEGRPIEIEATGPPRTPSTRLARLVVSPAARRLAVSRVGRAIVGLTLVGLLLVVGGSSLSRSVVNWLHQQPEYRVAFEDLELEPPPPPYIKGGRERLLEQVRADRGHSQLFSMLDLDLASLRKDFALNPWVLRVEGASKVNPNRIRMRITYREPIAIVVTPREAVFPVDRDLVVLPEDDFDPARSSPLIKILVDEPAETPVAGVTWPAVSKGSSSDRFKLAVKLATFFLDRMREEPASPGSLQPLIISARDPQWIFVEMKPESWVFWYDLSESSDPFAISDAEKWHQLKARAAHEGGLGVSGQEIFLEVDKTGVKERRSKGHRDRPVGKDVPR